MYLNDEEAKKFFADLTLLSSSSWREEHPTVQELNQEIDYFAKVWQPFLLNKNTNSDEELAKLFNAVNTHLTKYPVTIDPVTKESIDLMKIPLWKDFGKAMEHLRSVGYTLRWGPPGGMHKVD